MELKVKKFNELTTAELYELLRARSEVFVVGQKCAYQDMDGRDYRSLHFFYEEKGRVAACLRAFSREGEEGTLQIGRVLTVEHGRGMGRRLLEESIKFIREKTEAKRLFMEAQEYAAGFYEKFGFTVTSDVFLEDGIPHVAMELDLRI
ncbi:MAG TPA: GNAT family N-acetyltransferase [Candidatus Copromorpha excrementigallinarum]|uniref:GNAT family N-acetyltransferase n=1 Tax=Candidatus Allocopromorpha excrementigallinarum TaxID=2840742 RepID=A0A9D1HYS9_9FIRM|nr:GNAT family N-acetyltransferase [Candidatus Copromorpha excrementigallinarum]